MHEYADVDLLSISIERHRRRRRRRSQLYRVKIELPLSDRSVFGAAKLHVMSEGGQKIGLHADGEQIGIELDVFVRKKAQRQIANTKLEMFDDSARRA